MVGSLQLTGLNRRDTKVTQLKIKTAGTPLCTALLQAHPHRLLQSATQRRGRGCDRRYRCESRHPTRAGVAEIEHSIAVRIAKGKLRHPKLPLPLDDIQGLLECDNGTLRLTQFEARSKETLVKGRIAAQFPRPDQAFEADLELQHVTIESSADGKASRKAASDSAALSSDRRHRGPSRLRRAQWPVGEHGRRRAVSRITMLPEDGRACFAKFPYPLEKITGSIDWLPQTKTTEVDITGYAQDRPVLIHGIWQGEGINADASFDLHATDIPLDDKLIAAASVKVQKLTNSFHPTGKLALKVHMKNARTQTFTNEFHIYLREGTVKWDEFPYPLEQSQRPLRDLSAPLGISWRSRLP